MDTIEVEFRYLILRAVRENDSDRAQQLREWAFERFDLDLLDYAKHPSMHVPAAA